MATTLHKILLDIQEVLALWLLVVAVVAAIVVVWAASSALARRNRARAARPSGTEVQLRRTLVAQAAELHRYAEEVRVAAERAAVTAEQRQAEWLALQHAQEAAWRAYDEADAATRRVVRATAYPAPDGPLTPAERAARERYLHRAATGAYRRGELSVEQLCEVLTHRNGWDLGRHPFDHEAQLRRIGRNRLLHTYRTVSDLERTTWSEACVAAAARRSLVDEAFAAALRAHRAQSRLTAAVPRQRHSGSVRRPVRRPLVALAAKVPLADHS